MKARIQSLRLLAVLAAAVAFAACGDDSDSSNTDAGADVGVDTGDTTGDATPDVGPDTTTDATPDGTPDVDPDGSGDAGDTTAPEITGFVVTENPANGLSAFVEVETDEDVTVTVTATDADDNVWWTWTSEEAAGLHEAFALGFTPELSVTFTVIATDAAGNEATDEAAFTSAALPEDFPPIEVTVSNPEAMSPGVTMFNVFRWLPDIDAEWGYLIAVNAEGVPVWYHKVSDRAADIQLLSTGTIAFEYGDNVIAEIQWDGSLLNEWAADDLGVDTFHHEVYEMPNGSLLTLGTEVRVIDGYPAPEGSGEGSGEGEGSGDTVSYNVVADRIVEFDRDGTVVYNYSLFDIIDPLYIRPGFDAPFWDIEYSDVEGGTKDWTHGNSVIYDESDDSYILSLRHQDAVIKVDRETGDLVWWLGFDGDFEMIGGGEFQFHQHAPEIQGESGLLIYDNGNARTPAPEGGPFSRVVEYVLDTEEMTVEQVWEYRGDPYFAPFVGDADMLDGTVLITDGGLTSNPAGGIGAPDNIKSARIREVTYGDSPEIVFELGIEAEGSGEGPTGYTIYRADRVMLPGMSEGM